MDRGSHGGLSVDFRGPVAGLGGEVHAQRGAVASEPRQVGDIALGGPEIDHARRIERSDPRDQPVGPGQPQKLPRFAGTAEAVDRLVRQVAAVFVAGKPAVEELPGLARQAVAQLGSPRRLKFG